MDDLPTELLIEIFNYVYLGIRVPVGDTGIMGLDPDDDPLSPSIFPYSLSSVSERWREIMSAVPEFWTRLVVFVDSSNPTSLSNFRSEIEWSQNLSLSVTIIRRGDSPGTVENEKIRLRTATEIISRGASLSATT